LAANRSENKRVKVGLAIFAVLVLANVFVHGGRMLRQSAPPAQPPKTPAAPLKPAVSPIVAASDNITALISDGPTTFIEKQTAVLSESLNKLKKALEKVPAMKPEPDFEVVLAENENDWFVWRPSRLPGQPIATQTFVLPEKVAMTVTGRFRIGNKTKLLVRTASTTFVVEPDSGKDNSDVTLISEDGQAYVIKDRGGVSRVINEQKSPKERLKDAVDTLRGVSGQHEYRLLSPAPAKK